MPKTLNYEIVSTDALVVESATARVEQKDGEEWKEVLVVDIMTTGPQSSGSLLMGANQRVIFEDARMVALYDEEQMATILVKATDIPEGQSIEGMSMEEQKEMLRKIQEKSAVPLRKEGAPKAGTLPKADSPKVEPPKADTAPKHEAPRHEAPRYPETRHDNDKKK